MSLRRSRRASRWRSSGPTARARRRCCRSSPACRRRRRARSAARPRDVGWVPAAAGGLRASSRSPRTCALFARLERCRRPATRSSSGCSSQTGLARPRRRRARDAVGRQPPAREHRRRPARRPAVLLLDEPSSSLDPRQRERLWEFVGGLAARRHRGRVHHAQRRRGRALRRPRARAGRRRAALRGHAGGAARGGRQRRPRLRGGVRRASCTSAGTERARRAFLLARTCRSCGARRCWSALLVVYPVVIALLIGLALSKRAGQAAGRDPQRAARADGRRSVAGHDGRRQRLRQRAVRVDRRR